MFYVVLLRRMLCTQHKKYKTTMRSGVEMRTSCKGRNDYDKANSTMI